MSSVQSKTISLGITIGTPPISEEDVSGSYADKLRALKDNIFENPAAFAQLGLERVQKLKMQYVNALSASLFVHIPAEHFSESQVLLLGDDQLSCLTTSGTIIKIVNYLTAEKLFNVLESDKIDKVQCLQAVTSSRLEQLLKWGECTSDKNVNVFLIDLFKKYLSTTLRPYWQLNLEQVTFVRVNKLMLSIFCQCALSHNMVENSLPSHLSALFNFSPEFVPSAEFVQRLNQEQVLALCEAALNDRTQGPLLRTVAAMIDLLPNNDPNDLRLKFLGDQLQLRIPSLSPDQLVYILSQPKLAFLFATLTIGRFTILFNRISSNLLKFYVLTQAIKYAPADVTQGYFHKISDPKKFLEDIVEPIPAATISRLISRDQTYEFAKKMDLPSLLSSKPSYNVIRVAIFLLDTIPTLVPQAWFDVGVDCMSPEQMEEALKSWDPLPADKLIKGLKAILWGVNPRCKEQVAKLFKHIKTDYNRLISTYFAEVTKETFMPQFAAALILYIPQEHHFKVMQNLQVFMYRENFARIDCLPPILKSALLLNLDHHENLQYFINLLTNFGCTAAEIVPDFSREQDKMIFTASSQNAIKWWLDSLERFSFGLQDRMEKMNAQLELLKEFSKKTDVTTREKDEYAIRARAEIASTYIPLEFIFTMKHILNIPENQFLLRSYMHMMIYPLLSPMFAWQLVKGSLQYFSRPQFLEWSKKFDKNQLCDALRLAEKEFYDTDIWTWIGNHGVTLTKSKMSYKGEVYVEDIGKLQLLGFTTTGTLVAHGLLYPGEPIINVLIRLRNYVNQVFPI